MNRTIMITGISGCGKSTLIKKIKDEYEIDTMMKFVNPETGKKYNFYTNGQSLYILGKYEDRTFGGVDSFAPKTAMVDLIEYIKENDRNAIILCEGWVFKRYHFDDILFLNPDIETIRQRLYNRSMTSNRKFDNEKFDTNIKKWESFKKSLVNKWHATLVPYDTKEQMDDAFLKITSEIDDIQQQNSYFDFIQ